MDIKKQKQEDAKRTHLALKKQNASSATTEQEQQWFTKILMEWEPVQFRDAPRGDNWYLWLGIAAAILITIAILTKTYIVAVTFFLLAVVLVMFAQKPIKRHRVRITDTGIEVGEQFYPYHKLKSFWILYNPPQVTTLNFQQRDKISLNINIEIEDEDPVKIRDILLEYLTEEENKEEDFIDAISRRLHF